MQLSDWIATANTLVVFAAAVIAMVTLLLMREERRSFIRSQAPTIHAVNIAVRDGDAVGSKIGRVIDFRLMNTGARDAENLRLEYVFIPPDPSDTAQQIAPRAEDARFGGRLDLPLTLASSDKLGLVCSPSFLDGLEASGHVMVKTTYTDSKTGDRLTTFDHWILDGTYRNEDRWQPRLALLPLMRNWPQAPCRTAVVSKGASEIAGPQDE